MRFLYFFILYLSLNSIFAEAIDIHQFNNPTLQKRYNSLVQDIRCPVCQGQSIGGSNAPLATDLRNIVYDMLMRNKSDSEIFKFMTDRYGDFVLFKPPVNYHTYILWLGPFIFLIIALIAIIRKISKK